MSADFLGRWRIVEMAMWDQDALDLVEPAFLTISADGTGLIGFIAVSGSIDCRFDGENAVDFTWDGSDDGSMVSGRGHARMNADGELVGRIFFHLGDDSSFRACRSMSG